MQVKKQSKDAASWSRPRSSRFPSCCEIYRHLDILGILQSWLGPMLATPTDLLSWQRDHTFSSLSLSLIHRLICESAHKVSRHTVRGLWSARVD